MEIVEGRPEPSGARRTDEILREPLDFLRVRGRQSPRGSRWTEEILQKRLLGVPYPLSVFLMSCPTGLEVTDRGPPYRDEIGAARALGGAPDRRDSPGAARETFWR